MKVKIFEVSPLIAHMIYVPELGGRGIKGGEMLMLDESVAGKLGAMQRYFLPRGERELANGETLQFRHWGPCVEQRPNLVEQIIDEPESKENPAPDLSKVARDMSMQGKPGQRFKGHK